jgi:hypothetical protein
MLAIEIVRSGLAMGTLRRWPHGRASAPGGRPWIAPPRSALAQPEGP